MQQTQALKDVLARMGITAEFEARGIEKGIAIGETKGIAKRKQEGIRNLLDFGMTPQQVSVALKVPLSMIDNIQEETHNSGG
ncbi:hypothetical protein ACYULU_13405 [Breznakiellaceae bacterium SP9]